MLILGIETSCDETAAAIVESGTKIISDVRATSFISKKFGGVVPDKTAREQLKFILPVIQECLLSANRLPLTAIDALAVTFGPGLIGSLLIGVETAKTLSLALNKPIIPINHLVGHIYANWVETVPPKFPALVLLVSGGHTELILMRNHGQFKLLGRTLDDAAGECFDKCGRLLGLPYPYGPFIEQEAKKYKTKNDKYKILLPRPLINQRNLDFSFSGLKTAFLYAFQRAQESGTLTENFKAALAFELEETVTDILVSKLKRALEKFKAESILVCGGVAANQKLRKKLQSSIAHCPLYIPPISLCTDNAVYIAAAAYFSPRQVPISKITADPGLDF